MLLPWRDKPALLYKCVVLFYRYVYNELLQLHWKCSTFNQLVERIFMDSRTIIGKMPCTTIELSTVSYLTVFAIE